MEKHIVEWQNSGKKDVKEKEILCHFIQRKMKLI